MNYYELFGLPMLPLVPAETLQATYFRLQRESHPDFFSQDDEASRDEAMLRSAEINKAYSVFRNKDKTLEYFLQQQGAVVTDEKYALPPMFLGEMMEINEAVDEGDKDTARRLVEEQASAIDDELSPVIGQQKEAWTEEDLAILKSAYYRKKYLRRILDRMAD
jgi:molecular chaperone HscB